MLDKVFVFSRFIIYSIIFTHDGDNYSFKYILVAVLHHEHTKNMIVVANAHILFNESRGEIKIGQVCFLSY
jgi:hypothetical protein